MLVISALPLHAQEWVVERYNSDNGLPQNSVVSLLLDDQGYAWATTEGGLVRYDGARPERIKLPVPEEGPQRMRDIVQVGAGQAVIRDSHGRTFLLEKGRLLPLGRMDVDRDPYPFCNGAVPFLDAYLFTLRHRWWGPKSFDWTDNMVTLIPLSEHDWLATSMLGLLHMRDTTLVGVIPASSKQDRFFGTGGRVFGFDEHNQAFRVDPNARTIHPIVLSGVTPPADGFPSEFFDATLCSNTTTPCVRVGGELFVLSASAAGDTLFATPLHITLPTNTNISAIVMDARKDVVLVGTSTEGLFVYRRTPMRTLRCPIDRPGTSNVFYAQTSIDGHQAVVMGWHSAHGFTAEGCDPSPLPVDSFNFQGMLRDHAGRIWTGQDSLISRYDPATGSHWSIRTGQGRSARVLCFWEEGDSVWVGLDCGRGFGYVRNDRFVHTCSGDSTKRSRDPYMIRRGPDGHLWYASCAGAFRFDRNVTRTTIVPGTEGLCVRNLQLIGKRLYLGTYGSGAWIYEDDSLRHLPRDRMGYLDQVHCFMPDSLGFLWLSTNHGLFRVHQREIDAFLKDADHPIYYAYYGKAAGIVNTEFNGGCDPPYLRLDNGYASFPSLDGLVWFRPEQIPDPYPTVPIRLDEVVLDGKPVPDSVALSLAPERHELIVRFSVAYWGDPANVQLQYRLPGVQDEWYPLADGQRELRFQHLPHGDHVLTIRKAGSPPDGHRGDLVLHFSVRRPFYMAAWFVVLCTMVLVLMYGIVLRVYQLRLRRKNIALGRMVRSRTLELQLINQRLERSVTVKERLVSIISHDIVTPLRFIARVAHRVERVSGETPAEEISGTLHDIALSSDKLYMNARNLLNWIKHQGGQIELRRLNVAMAALVDDTLGPVRELASTKGTELLNMVPLDDIVHTDRDVVGIILQNLVNNALNHGEGGRVVVSGEQRPDAYRLVVADDGPGLPERTANAIRLLQQGSGRGRAAGSDVLGLGYVIITELLQLLGGELLIADNAGRGSRITVVLPKDTEHRSNGAGY